MDADSNATVLMEDDPPRETYSSTCETNDKKGVLVGGENWIIGASIQDTIIFRSINSHASKHAVESDIMEAVVEWEVEGGPRRSIVSRIHEQNDCDCKRHSNCHRMHCGFEGKDGGPYYRCC
jgi:hypothetical protein